MYVLAWVHECMVPVSIVCNYFTTDRRCFTYFTTLSWTLCSSLLNGYQYLCYISPDSGGTMSPSVFVFGYVSVVLNKYININYLVSPISEEPIATSRTPTGGDDGGRRMVDAMTRNTCTLRMTTLTSSTQAQFSALVYKTISLSNMVRYHCARKTSPSNAH